MEVKYSIVSVCSLCRLCGFLKTSYTVQLCSSLVKGLSKLQLLLVFLENKKRDLCFVGNVFLNTVVSFYIRKDFESGD